MAAVLALLSAVLFGAGDFFGGTAARRTHVLVVVAASHVIGLVMILTVAPVMADAVTGQDLAYGALAGLFGLLGIGCLYHCLGRGPMAVVAPTTAISNAVLPVLWGVAHGERLSAVNTAGVLLGLAAIGLVSGGAGIRRLVDAARVPPTLVLEALLAGVGFAGFYIFMAATTEASTPWPLVSARVVSAGLALLLLLRVGRSPIPKRAEGGAAVVFAGLLDMAANLAILLAIHRGLLSLTVVLSSLYPATTVILARTVLNERMSRGQVAGVVGALVAVACIVAG
ncbi:MAG: EamA family transporter [Actinomycetota bacterium]|nr:EamA family transporter [Acidimicrobiales bacterium]MEC8815001.1 EamA family transporter [Actinomycetota bacterium]MEC8970559.1 EamA family transporter [Actinomycetota bacterium]MEC9450731.1 EamA family transporter [Actinomycetota bacterium]